MRATRDLTEIHAVQPRRAPAGAEKQIHPARSAGTRVLTADKSRSLVRTAAFSDPRTALPLAAMPAFWAVVVFTAGAFELAAASTEPVLAQPTQSVCKGDTRGDRRCNHDQTHRVCAEIGDPHTSFWGFTGQQSWCGTVGNYGGRYGSLPRCPLDTPTWCICKWATASWIAGEGCSDNVSIDCAATDICATELGLFFSYNDFDVNLHPARQCVKSKCKEQWDACEAANPNFVASTGELGDGGDTGAVGLLLLTVVLGSVAVGYRLHKKRNATTDGSQTSPPLRAAHAHAGTAREELRAQYGRVTEDSDCESKAPQPAANIKSDGNGQPSRQSQYV